MRPYLAIIKDSFREALASRVLWVMTGLIAVILLALAPIGYKVNLTGEINWGEIADASQLVSRLRRDAASPEPSPGRRIWSLLDDETRKKLENLDLNPPDSEGPPAERRDGRERRTEAHDFARNMEMLRTSLNKLIARRDLYREEDWQNITLPKEATDYLARPRNSLTTEELARLNRLLIETPYQSSFVWRTADSVRVTYFWFSTPPLPFSKKQVDTVVKQWVLTTMMQWIVGVFGIIAAILVTSTVIPQMLEPGSITLLLSKPVSRSLLLTAKFFGACAFVFLNVTLLLVGLWLIAGTRLGIWNTGMLWCIPIFLFMFMIYYTISALTGLIWKSAIISVVLTVVFYFACLGLDLTHWFSQAFIIDQFRINRIVDAGGDLLTITEAGRLQLWDEEARTWRLISEPRGGPRIPTFDGPYYRASNKQLVLGQGFRNPFGLRGQRVSLKIASAADGWKLRDGPATPSGAAALLLANDDSIIAITSDNIYRFQGDLSSKGPSVSLFGLKIPLLGSSEFRPCLSGERSNFPDPVVAAADPTQPRLAVSAANDVYLFKIEADGRVTQTARRTLDAKEKEGAAIALAGNLVLVAREDGKVLLLSADDLSLKEELVLEPQSQPRFVGPSCDGSRFAILFQNRYLWLIDAATGAARRAPLSAQGQISGFTWTPDRLLVADYANRVVAYDPDKLTRDEIYRPALTRWELAYYYLIDPLHAAFPKPRLLNNTVEYVLTGKRTSDPGILQGDLSQQREDLHPWQPIKSGLGFVAVLLLLACIYIERQEF